MLQCSHRDFATNGCRCRAECILANVTKLTQVVSFRLPGNMQSKVTVRKTELLTVVVNLPSYPAEPRNSQRQWQLIPILVTLRKVVTYFPTVSLSKNWILRENDSTQ